MSCSDLSPESVPLRFWDDFLPVVERAFGVWTHRDAAVDWARHTWKLLIEEGLVPDKGCYRDNAVALVTLLALANVYRDFCMAAFEEVSYTVDLAYAAEEVAPTVVPDLAIARLAGELDVDTDRQPRT